MAPIPLTSQAPSALKSRVRLNARDHSCSSRGRGVPVTTWRHHHWHASQLRGSSQQWKCLGTESDVTTSNAPGSTPENSASSNSGTSSSSNAKSEGLRIRKTMADLDALLGIQEEDKSKANTSSQPASNAASSSADHKQEQPGAHTPATSSSSKKSGATDRPDMEEHIQKIIDKARKLADEQSTKGASSSSEKEQQALKQEFESLLVNLAKPQDILSKDDIKVLKDTVFGPLTYWVTETRPIQEAERTGLLIRGNLRDDRDKVFDLLRKKVAELFGGKFEVVMVEDVESEERGGGMGGMGGADTPSSSVGTARGLREGKRVAFQIIPTAQAQPPQPDMLQNVASVILGLLVVASCMQLALSSNVLRLPKETLDFLANPTNLNSDQLPPGLENWDPSVYVATALPIAFALLGVNIAHEVGHRVAAAAKNVKLGPTFFVPFGQIGSLGAITPFTSLLQNRSTMWDVSIAGPLGGALLAAGLLVFGLAQSAGVDPSDAAASASFISIPTPLFQSSVLMGGVARLALGEQALRGTAVLVHPFVIAGWWGLFTSALNLLPVGRLDGGRMVQAAYGQQSLALTSFFTYLGLGLGFLGGNIALPFGLYVIICQRTAEKYIQDNVSPVGDARMSATAVAVLVAILIVLPMAPELADAFGVGPTSPFL